MRPFVLLLATVLVVTLWAPAGEGKRRRGFIGRAFAKIGKIHRHVKRIGHKVRCMLFKKHKKCKKEKGTPENGGGGGNVDLGTCNLSARSVEECKRLSWIACTSQVTSSYHKCREVFTKFCHKPKQETSEAECLRSRCESLSGDKHHDKNHVVTACRNGLKGQCKEQSCKPVVNLGTCNLSARPAEECKRLSWIACTSQVTSSYNKCREVFTKFCQTPKQETSEAECLRSRCESLSGDKHHDKNHVVTACRNGLKGQCKEQSCKPYVSRGTCVLSARNDAQCKTASFAACGSGVTSAFISCRAVFKLHCLNPSRQTDKESCLKKRCDTLPSDRLRSICRTGLAELCKEQSCKTNVRQTRQVSLTRCDRAIRRCIHRCRSHPVGTCTTSCRSTDMSTSDCYDTCRGCSQDTCVDMCIRSKSCYNRPPVRRSRRAGSTTTTTWSHAKGQWVEVDDDGTTRPPKELPPQLVGGGVFAARAAAAITSTTASSVQAVQAEAPAVDAEEEDEQQEDEQQDQEQEDRRPRRRSSSRRRGSVSVRKIDTSWMSRAKEFGKRVLDNIERIKSKRAAGPCDPGRHAAKLRKLTRAQKRIERLAAKCGDTDVECVSVRYRAVTKIKRRLARSIKSFSKRCKQFALNLKARKGPRCSNLRKWLVRQELKRQRLNRAASKCDDEDVVCVRDVMSSIMRVNRRVQKAKRRCQVAGSIAGSVTALTTSVSSVSVPALAPGALVTSSLWSTAITCEKMRIGFAQWLRYQRSERQRLHDKACKCLADNPQCMQAFVRRITAIQKRIRRGRSHYTRLVTRCDKCAPVRLRFERWLSRAKAHRKRLHAAICKCPVDEVGCVERKVKRIKKLQARILEGRQRIFHMNADCDLPTTSSSNSTGGSVKVLRSGASATAAGLLFALVLVALAL